MLHPFICERNFDIIISIRFNLAHAKICWSIYYFGIKIKISRSSYLELGVVPGWKPAHINILASRPRP